MGLITGITAGKSRKPGRFSKGAETYSRERHTTPTGQSIPASGKRGKKAPPLPEGHEAFFVSVVVDQPQTLGEVAAYLAALDRAWILASNLAAYKLGHELSLDPHRPSHLKVSLNSPLHVELREIAIPAGGIATAFGLFVYILKHPKELSAWVPNLVLGWNEGWTEAERAKRERAAMQLATSGGVDLSVAEAHPMVAFEEDTRDVERMLKHIEPTSLTRTTNVKVPE